MPEGPVYSASAKASSWDLMSRKVTKTEKLVTACIHHFGFLYLDEVLSAEVRDRWPVLHVAAFAIGVRVEFLGPGLAFACFVFLHCFPGKQEQQVNAPISCARFFFNPLTGHGLFEIMMIPLMLGVNDFHGVIFGLA